MIKPTIEIVVPIIFFLIFVLAIYYSSKKRKEALAKLSNYLNGAISKFSLASSFKGEYQGIKFTISLVQGGESSPPYLKIILLKNSLFKLKIYKETALSKLGKRIGVIREVKINDEMFNKEFLIFSNNPVKTTNYFNNENIKKTISELFKNGFDALLLDGKRILIQKPYYNLEFNLEPQSIMRTLQKLILLTKSL